MVQLENISKEETFCVIYVLTIFLSGPNNFILSIFINIYFERFFKRIIKIES